MPRLAAFVVTVGLGLTAGLAGAATSATSAAADVVLPAPDAQNSTDPAVCQAVGCTPDRRRLSKVPGPVINDEVVLVDLDGGGAPSAVSLEQRLMLTGQGDYQVRERGPARSAVTLGDFDPPITKLGTVVWEGFTPGGRTLAARLTLDAAIESAHLPLAVSLRFTGANGRAVRLPAGGRLPGKGTVTVHLTNETAQPAALPLPLDTDAAVVAAALDRVRVLAAAIAPARLPVAGHGLPTRVPGRSAGLGQGVRSVPLRIRAALQVTGTTATLAGPGTQPGPGGGTVAGTLAGAQAVDLTLAVAGPGTLRLDLTATPALDPRAVAPPDGFGTWAAWAARRPDLSQRQDALRLLVDTAAGGARAGAYSPYLGADLPGTGSTVFRYRLARAAPGPAPATALTLRRGPAALVLVAVLLLLANAALLWRRW